MTEEPVKDIPGACPTPLQLGRAGWDILHSSAAVYPYTPSKVQQEAMRNFIYSWSQLYACNWCAYHMRQYVAAHPPQVADKHAITRYVCELHNEVNGRLGKDLYDCDPINVLKRWHPGYPDKMADQPSLEERVAAEEQRVAEEKRKKLNHREAQESRLTVFGWEAGRGHKEPEAWRASPAAADAPPPPHHQQQQPVAPVRQSSRWWFFGGSAYDGEGRKKNVAEAGGAAATPPAPQQQQQQQQQTVSPPNGGNSGTGGGGGGEVRRGKAADSETDVEAVLARLRACQVYCPEDEQLLPTKATSH